MQNLKIYRYSHYFNLNRFLLRRLIKSFITLGNLSFCKYETLKWIIVFHLNNSTSLTIRLMKLYFNMFFKTNHSFSFKKYTKIMPFFLGRTPKANLIKIFQRNFVFFGFLNKKSVMNFLMEFYKLKLIPYIFIPLNLVKYKKSASFFALQHFRLNQILGFNFENKQEFLTLYLTFITKFFYYLFFLFFSTFFYKINQV